jgi:hypothetical protein
MRFRPHFKKFRPSETFGRILNYPIVAFQTRLIESLSKAGLAKVETRSFQFVGCKESSWFRRPEAMAAGPPRICFD